jgi:hypothetical protein
VVTEDLNRQWNERNTGNAITDVQSRAKHPVIRFMAATLDGVVAGTRAVYEAKLMLPWSFSEEAVAEKYMAQLPRRRRPDANGRAARCSRLTRHRKFSLVNFRYLVYTNLMPHANSVMQLVVGGAMTKGTSSLGGDMAARSDQALEYDHRMFVNALATVAITFMIVTGYWVVSTLAETVAH